MTNPLEALSAETLEAFQKAQTTGIQSGTGVYSYDLTNLVSLIPVVTPLRDSIAREQSTDGNPFATWRAFMNITNQQPSPFMGFDYAAAEVLFNEQDFQAKYVPIGLAGSVTQDSLDLGKGYDDTYAETSFQVLNQVLIGEDKALFGGQSFALPRPAAPTLVVATTGGTIPSTTTDYIAVAARTGMGYYYGGNSRGNSTAFTTGGGTETNKVTASVAAVKGALAYDWFYSADNITFYYVRTTTVASTVFTSVTGANATPGGVLLPDLASWAPTLNLAADNGSAGIQGSVAGASFDGLFASITADYSAAGAFGVVGTGTANPAQWIDNGGATLTFAGGSVTEIETLFSYLWNAVKCSPTSLMMNAFEAQKIANLILGANSATTFLQTDESGRVNITAGGRVGQIINTSAGGVTVPIIVQVSMPPGVIVARTDRVPFPQAKISSVLAVRTLRDMSQYDYASARIANTLGGGPRKEFEIRSVEAFVNRAPVSMGAIVNIG